MTVNIDKEMLDQTTSSYKTIGEVSNLLSIPQHVLRFWETKFSQIAPMKINSRRYYSKQTIELIIDIKYLLYDRAYSIKGVQQYLKEHKSHQAIDQNKSGHSDNNLLKIYNSLLKIKKQISDI